MFGCTQLNIEGRLDLDGFRNITEQTATIARLMNAIYLQTHLKLEAVTMEDIITEVLDVPSLSLFHKINEQDIRETVSDMNAFDLLTTVPIDERVRIFDEFLFNDNLSELSNTPNLSAYANLQINYSVAFDSSWQAGMDMSFLVGATLLDEKRADINNMKALFKNFMNSTEIMIEDLKNFYKIYENKLHHLKLARSQFERVGSISSSLKALRKVSNETFLKGLVEQLNKLKLYTPILESWVNSSYGERIRHQARFIINLLRKSDKTFDQKFLIGLPNGSRDLAELSQDFQEEWLKNLLHDGKSLDELETLLKPMRKIERQLSSIEKIWHNSARSEYLNCIYKFLKSTQGLNPLKLTNISLTLPNAIAALDNLSQNYTTKYIREFVDEFDIVVNPCLMQFTGWDSELTNFYLKRNDSYFFNGITNINSAYPVNEGNEKQLEYLDNLPYQDYASDLNFTSDAFLSFKQKDRNITDCIPKITDFWKKFHLFSLTFPMAYNSDVKEVTNMLRVIKNIVPFTKNEHFNITGLTEYLLAAKAELSKSKKLDADLQQEMKHVDVNRMLSFSNARDIAFQFAHYHRTLVFYQKPELLQFFHNFRSNGLQLAKKIDHLSHREKLAVGQIWQKMLEGNQTTDELTIIKFLTAVVDAEDSISKNYSRIERSRQSLTSLAKALFNLNEITFPMYNFMMMRESIDALKYTSLGQSEEVSSVERSIAQLEGVYSSLAHEKYQLGKMFDDADKDFESFFTKQPQPPEDW
uniref:WSN domain-containing protein n=1 Tax=Caenorhabditis japonica TaxID=281687 RepID=A0A8R1E1D2_CAEJA